MEMESYTDFDIAVRVEQSAHGGTAVPSCHTTADPKTIFADIEPADGGALCSCLYKNWRPPIPTKRNDHATSLVRNRHR
jgi:hypothetical protein